MTERDRKRESGDILEHMPLEEVRIEDIGHIDPPEEWDPEVHDREPHVPPVLIEETARSGEGGTADTDTPAYTVLAQHRSFWRMMSRGHLSIRALVVRSGVHISLAHESIGNCVEEALLFEGLLRNGLVENRSRLSELLGYSRARITQILNLMKLPEDMRRKLLLTDDVSEFQLRPLIRVTDPVQQQEMFAKLIAGKLTGRQMALFASGRTAEVEEAVGEPATEERPASTLSDLEELIASGTEEGEGKAVAAREVSAGDRVEVRVRRETGSPAAHAGRCEELLRRLGSLGDSDWEMKARELRASELDIILLRGIALLRTGLYAQAVEMLEVAIENEPDLAPGYFYLGRCSNLTGALSAAEGYLRTALELVPDHPDYMVELAIVLEKLRRNAEASTFYRKAGALRKKTQGVAEK